MTQIQKTFADNLKDNVELKPEFKQVCVWPGTLCVNGGLTIEALEEFFMTQFNTRIQYLEEYITPPDRDRHGYSIPGTGGRNDLIFAVHAEDVSKFAAPRLSFEIRWIEDALDHNNGGSDLYPARMLKYKSWNN